MKEDCDRIRELFSPFIDGELAPEEREIVEDHLIECEVCQKEFGRLKELDLALSQIEVEEPSHGFHRRLIHTLGKEYAKRRRKRSFLIQIAPLAAAASILLIVLVSSQTFFMEYPTEAFRTPSYERGVETVTDIDVKSERPLTAGRAVTREIARPAEVPMVTKREVISRPPPQRLVTPEEQKKQGLGLAPRVFDKTTRPRATRIRNEFEFEVDPTDIVVQQLPRDQRIGIVVDLDSEGNVLRAELIKTTGSDSVDSAVVQNVRNQNFRTLTEGIEKFPSRQEIYYRFRQTGR